MIISKLGIISSLLVSLHSFNPQLINIETINKNEIKCLAENIYFESRKEIVEGRLAVANVTMNRVASPRYPNTVCKVVWQKIKNKKTGKYVAMFSWTLDKHSKTINLKSSKGKPILKNIKDWEEASTIAIFAYLGLTNDITNGATHYYNPNIASPKWGKDGKLDPVYIFPNGIIGNHRFLLGEIK